MIDEWNFWKWLLTEIAASFSTISTWGFLIVFLTASCLCWLDKIDSTAWALVVSIGFGFFLGYKGFRASQRKTSNE